VVDGIGRRDDLAMGRGGKPEGGKEKQPFHDWGCKVKFYTKNCVGSFLNV
jgi:hypothetical protein